MIFRNHNTMLLIAQEIFLNMTTALCFLFVIFLWKSSVQHARDGRINTEVSIYIYIYIYIYTDASFENIDT